MLNAILMGNVFRQISQRREKGGVISEMRKNCQSCGRAVEVFSFTHDYRSRRTLARHPGVVRRSVGRSRTENFDTQSTYSGQGPPQALARLPSISLPPPLSLSLYIYLGRHSLYDTPLCSTPRVLPQLIDFSKAFRCFILHLSRHDSRNIEFPAVVDKCYRKYYQRSARVNFCNLAYTTWTKLERYQI